MQGSVMGDYESEWDPSASSLHSSDPYNEGVGLNVHGPTLNFQGLWKPTYMKIAKKWGVWGAAFPRRSEPSSCHQVANYFIMPRQTDDLYTLVSLCPSVMFILNKSIGY